MKGRRTGSEYHRGIRCSCGRERRRTPLEGRSRKRETLEGMKNEFLGSRQCRMSPQFRSRFRRNRDRKTTKAWRSTFRECRNVLRRSRSKVKGETTRRGWV